MSKESQGHLLLNICEASGGICSHSMGSTPDRKYIKVEAVQRRAARFVTGYYRYNSNVTVMTESLSWETLQHRRQQAKAIMMFRIVHAMVAISAFHTYNYWVLLQEATITSTESHTAGPIHTKIPSSRQVSECGTSCLKS